MIPEEAVLAGAAAIQVRLDKNMGLNDLTRAILEAAAPHMLAEVWCKGYGAGWNDCILELQNDGAKSTPNPYRSRS